MFFFFSSQKKQTEKYEAKKLDVSSLLFFVFLDSIEQKMYNTMKAEADASGEIVACEEDRCIKWWL